MAQSKNLGSVDVGYNTGPEQQESAKGTIGRNLAQAAIETGERVLGAPANFAEGLLGLANTAIELLPGVEKSPLPETLHLPTSERIHKYVTEPIAEKVLPAGYLETQGEGEDLAHTAWKDFVDIWTGGKLLRGVKAVKGLKAGAKAAQGLAGLGAAAEEALPFGKTFAKALKFLRPTEITAGKAAMLSGLGNLASFGTKKLGGGEGAQAGAKIGTMLAASLGGPNAIANEIKDRFSAMNKVKPPTGAKVPAKNLYEDIHNLRTEAFKGASEKTMPEKKILDNFLDDIRSKIDFRDNTIPVDQALALKQDANQILLKLDPNTDKVLRGRIKQVSGILNKSIKGPEAQEKYPEFVHAIKQADELMAGFENVSEASKFLIGHKILDDVSNPFTRIVFLGNLGEGLKSTAKMFAYQGALRNTVVPMEMFVRSPAIRSYYYKAMGAALANNATVANKYIKKFDKEANRLYPGYQEGAGTVE